MIIFSKISEDAMESIGTWFSSTNTDPLRDYFDDHDVICIPTRESTRYSQQIEKFQQFIFTKLQRRLNLKGKQKSHTLFEIEKVFYYFFILITFISLFGL